MNGEKKSRSSRSSTFLRCFGSFVSFQTSQSHTSVDPSSTHPKSGERSVHHDGLRYDMLPQVGKLRVSRARGSCLFRSGNYVTYLMVTLPRSMPVVNVDNVEFLYSSTELLESEFETFSRMSIVGLDLSHAKSTIISRVHPKNALSPQNRRLSAGQSPLIFNVDKGSNLLSDAQSGWCPCRTQISGVKPN